MEIFNKEYDLAIEKASATMEAEWSAFNINILEATCLMNDGYVDESEDVDMSLFEEATASLVDGIKKFFESIIQAIKDLTGKILTAIGTKIITAEIKHLQKEQIKALAQLRSANSNGTINVKRTSEYIKIYNKYLDESVKAIIELSHTQKDADQYAKKAIELDRKLADFSKNIRLTSSEACTINAIGVDGYYKLKEDCDETEKLLKEMSRMTTESIIKIRDAALKEDDPHKIRIIQNTAQKVSTLFRSATETVLSMVKSNTSKLNSLLLQNSKLQVIKKENNN